MPHDDFFESTLIEFSEWNRGKEKTIATFEKFDDLPFHLKEHFKTDSEISLQERNWKILEINRDLRAHGNGMHVKVRLESVL